MYKLKYVLPLSFVMLAKLACAEQYMPEPQETTNSQYRPYLILGALTAGALAIKHQQDDPHDQQLLAWVGVVAVSAYGIKLYVDSKSQSSLSIDALNGVPVLAYHMNF